MAINVANWQDKELDELDDLTKTADHSEIASFVMQNYLAKDPSSVQGRVMTDASQTDLRVTANGATQVNLTGGVFSLGGKIGDIESTQVVTIFNGIASGDERWAIICVRVIDTPHTAADRWFVDDTVNPNTYAKQSVYTLMNKASYEIVVDLVTDTKPSNAAAGYWAIAEVKIPAAATAIGDIYDTTGTSQATIPNWTPTTRVTRLEFWSTLFNTDHDSSTGYHRSGMHIGSTVLTATGTEMNAALTGIGGTVTAAKLTSLTNGSNVGTMHLHSGAASYWNDYTSIGITLTSSWVDLLSLNVDLGANPATLLFMFSVEANPSTWGFRVRILDGATPLPGRSTPELGGWGFLCVATRYSTGTAQYVSTLSAGVHTIKLQGIRQLGDVDTTKSGLTILKLG